MGKTRPLIPSDQLVKRLRLMADVGGMLTKDRVEAIRQAADRIAFCLEKKEGESHEEH